MGKLIHKHISEDKFKEFAMRKLPKSRDENIVVQNLETEVLIYDILMDTAYCLNETSAKVFNHCDGKTSFDELKQKFKLTDEVIYLALDELKKHNLLVEEYASPFAGMTRREAVRRVGLTTFAALPLIATVVAPTAANAASGNTCTTGICIAAGQNVCAGCANRTIITNSYFSSTNGTCSGAATPPFPVNCGTGATFSPVADVRRV